MKKLLAALLALVLVLTGTLALADGYTVTAALTFDPLVARDLLPVYNEDEMRTIDDLLAVVNALEARLDLSKAGTRLGLTLNGVDLASVDAVLNDQGLVVTGTPFPHYALTMSMDALQTALSRFSGSLALLNGLDPALEAFGRYLSQFGDSLIQAITLGEPEAGDYTMFDIPFNRKTPMLPDMPAIYAAIFDLVDQLNQDEAVQVALQALREAGVNVSLPTYLPPSSEVKYPDVRAYAYTVEDEESNGGLPMYVTVQFGSLLEENPVFLICLLVGEDSIKVELVSIDGDEENELTLTLTTRDGGMNALLESVSPELYAGLGVDADFTDDVDVTVELFYPSSSKALATLRLNVPLSEPDIPGTEVGDRTVLAIEDLMSGDEASISALNADFMTYGLGNMLDTARQAMPDQYPALQALFNQPVGGEE